MQLLPLAGRSPIGSRVVLHGRGKKKLTKIVVSASSYLSQSPSELVFGLGTLNPAKLEVIWPDGTRSEHNGLREGHDHRVTQGTKKLEHRPYRSRR